MAKESKYRVLKFDGNDSYSYAVFHTKDVRGMSSPIVHHPTPIVCGMGFREAHNYKKRLESKSA